MRTSKGVGPVVDGVTASALALHFLTRAESRAARALVWAPVDLLGRSEGVEDSTHNVRAARDDEEAMPTGVDKPGRESDRAGPRGDLLAAMMIDPKSCQVSSAG